ncbi:MAG: hypothetical protein IJN86_01945 [Clostridia bacterium]|nr:hypothetical protein [Clostridia bacterium]
MSRPQDKHLIPLTERTEEEAHAIRSAGGKASQQKRKEKQMMADLLELYSGLPITDKRKKNRLAKLGIPTEELTQKLLVADALMRSAQAGNTYAIQLYMEITGEAGMGGPAKENNLLQAIQDSTKEDMDTDDLPELQQTAEADVDVVE